MKVRIMVEGNELVSGAGVQRVDNVQQIEIDLGDAGGFTIEPYTDVNNENRVEGVSVMARGSLVIAPTSGNVITLRSYHYGYRVERGPGWVEKQAKLDALVDLG